MLILSITSTPTAEPAFIPNRRGKSTWFLEAVRALFPGTVSSNKNSPGDSVRIAAFVGSATIANPALSGFFPLIVPAGLGCFCFGSGNQ
jgi:hypothetical protein